MKIYQFQTERTVIRSYRKNDANAVWKVMRHPYVYATTAFIAKDYPRWRVDVWMSCIERSIRNKTGYEFGMFDRLTGDYIGNVGLICVNDLNRSAYLTYFIDPSRWNLGYATEGAEEMLRFAFGELDLHRVGGTCMSHNPASRRVMEKCGLEFVGTVRGELCKDGEFIDVDHFSLLKDDFIKTKGTVL